MNMSLEHLWSTMGWFAKGIVITLIFMSILVATIAITGTPLSIFRKGGLGVVHFH